MSLGTAIFLSSVFIGSVLLYGYTKDRWRWKRIAGGLALAVMALVLFGAGIAAVVDRRHAAERDRRVEANRAMHAVSLGDHFDRVLQRQGVPDTTFWLDERRLVTGYWDAGSNALDAERVFHFSDDSTLVEIRFLGDRTTLVERGWQPADGVTLGQSADVVVPALGEPCSHEVLPNRTVMRFETDEPGTIRYVTIIHGERTIDRHGWVRGSCQEY